MSQEPPRFDSLGLSPPLMQAISELGYEEPTSIQARTIPTLLQGRDLIGQAQTGTGKTAAFALPLLQALDPQSKAVQALVLAPTRELALQVAEAMHTYGRHLGSVRVLPVYGGEPIHRQLQRLRRGVQVVVGTPGRVMDHIRRGSLVLEHTRMVVLDEADEMLRMGFIEDVEWILEQLPGERQTALFSATMPPAIRRIAEKHLTNGEHVAIERPTLTVPTIEQRYVTVPQSRKVDVLTSILEIEETEAVLVFARTRVGANECAERLVGRGYAAETLHGEMNQAQREKVVRRLRSGQVEIVVATDVAARGLDVERISHVINLDVPYDAEAYVHRIGRTGRAGRAGIAILFVTPRERRLLRQIERYTGQRIEAMRPPSRADVAARRMRLLQQRVRTAIADEDLDPWLAVVGDLAEEGLDPADVAAAALRLLQGPIVELEVEEPQEQAPPEAEMVRLFITAGRREGVRPGDLVGAIASEARIPGSAIGAIDIHDHYAFVEVPEDHAEQVIAALGKATLRGRRVEVRLARPREERPRPTKRPMGRPRKVRFKKGGPRR